MQAISSQMLGGVEGIIGALGQAVGIITGAPGCKAGRQGDFQACCQIIVVSAGKGLPQPFQHFGNVSSAALRKQGDKFLSAVAGQHIGPAQSLTGNSGEALENIVTDLMTVLILDLLEVIQINQRQIKRFMRPLRQCNHFFQTFKKMTSVI